MYQNKNISSIEVGNNNFPNFSDITYHIDIIGDRGEKILSETIYQQEAMNWSLNQTKTLPPLMDMIIDVSSGVQM